MLRLRGGGQLKACDREVSSVTVSDLRPAAQVGDSPVYSEQSGTSIDSVLYPQCAQGPHSTVKRMARYKFPYTLVLIRP